MLAPNDLIPWLGFAAQGDIGPYSTYTRLNRSIVIFAKHEFDGERLTPGRLVMRNKFRCAAFHWRSLTPQERINWEAATKKLSLPLSGYALFVHWWTMHDSATIDTVSRQSGIPLLPTTADIPF